jgi:hypothetical protein
MLRSDKKLKIMMCAPSNAAIDEVAERVLSHGLFGIHGVADHGYNLVRVASHNYELSTLC